MKAVVTSEEMKKIEQFAIERMGVPSLLLMENAALAVVNHCIMPLLSCGRYGKSGLNTIVFAGGGNNGGDGLAVARLLFAREIPVQVAYVGDLHKAKNDNRIQLEIVRNMGIPLLDFREQSQKAAVIKAAKQSAVIVDALFGTGLKADISGVYEEAVALMNASPGFTVCIDIPSGIHTDSGRRMGSAVQGDETLVCGCYKPGNFTGWGKEHCGKLVLGNIGIPDEAPEIIQKDLNIFVSDGDDIGALLPKRTIRSNKGTYGRLVVIAGSADMPGAASLASLAAYRAGCGLVEVCSVAAVTAALTRSVKEAITTTLPEERGCLCRESYDALQAQGILDKADAILLGPGMGVNDATTDFMAAFLKNWKGSVPVLMDADALNMLAATPTMKEFLTEDIIITPHPGEMARLVKTTTNDVLEDTIGIATAFTKEYRAVTLLKDAATVIAGTDSVHINTTGNQSMAKAGAGDVLAGVIGALLAQGMPPKEAAIAGAYIHGRAGELASVEKGLWGVLATDIAQYVPAAFTAVMNPDTDPMPAKRTEERSRQNGS